MKVRPRPLSHHGTDSKQARMWFMQVTRFVATVHPQPGANLYHPLGMAFVLTRPKQ